MHRICIQIKRLLWDEKAQDMVEYALLAGFIAIAGAATLPDVAFHLYEIYTAIGYVLFLSGGGSAPSGNPGL